MDELLVLHQLRYKVKFLLEEIFNGLDVMVGYFLYILYVRRILLAEVLPYQAQTIQ